jgi:hypothetical protein
LQGKGSRQFLRLAEALIAMLEEIIRCIRRGRKPRVLEIAEVKIVALYEPNAGYIVHMHTITMFKGGRVVSEKEAIETAHREAASIGHMTEELKTKVTSDHEHAKHCNRIDPNTGKFVKAEPRRE